jgi:hypothetical protein
MVHRPHLNGNFPLIKGRLGLTVPGHAFYHFSLYLPVEHAIISRQLTL